MGVAATLADRPVPGPYCFSVGTSSPENFSVISNHQPVVRSTWQSLSWLIHYGNVKSSQGVEAAFCDLGIDFNCRKLVKHLRLFDLALLGGTRGATSRVRGR